MSEKDICEWIMRICFAVSLAGALYALTLLAIHQGGEHGIESENVSDLGRNGHGGHPRALEDH